MAQQQNQVRDDTLSTKSYTSGVSENVTQGIVATTHPLPPDNATRTPLPARGLSLQPSSANEEVSMTGISLQSLRTSSFAMSDVSERKISSQPQVDSSMIRKQYSCYSKNRKGAGDVPEPGYVDDLNTD